MSNPIRQQIVDAVKVRLQGILKSAGYLTDVGNNVYLCRSVPLTDEELDAGPQLNIWDIDKTTTAVAAKVHEHTLTVHVFLAAVGTGMDTLIRQIEADISKALNQPTNGLDGRLWATDAAPGGLAFYTMNTKSGYEIDGATKRRTGLYYFEFIIKYRTKAFDEMSLP